MGGFFYASKNVLPTFETLRGKSREQFEGSGFGKPVSFDTEAYILDYYPKIDYPSRDYLELPGGNFIFSTGTFIYRDQIGANALKLFYDEPDHDAALRESHGHFLIVLRKDGKTFLFRDLAGSYDLFLTCDLGCATTSFLAAAAMVEHCTINVQEAYEYVFNGVTLGEATVFKEIRRLGLFERLILEPAPSIVTHPFELLPPEDNGSFAQIVERNLKGLLTYAATLTRLFGDNIKVALSAGYDSRFLLALFRRAGITPKLFVYGSSGDSDVRIAKTIAQGEHITLNHVDKSLLVTPTPETAPEIVERNFFREDALPNGGIFSSGAELTARLQRSENGALHVNGGGGEIFRNFFNLPKRRSLTPRQFVWVFYRQFDPSECTDAFSADIHDRSIAEKITALLGIRSRTLSRRQIESLYPYFRCRSWFGRENSINSRWGYSVLPFFDHRTVACGLQIPIGYKHFGNFESAMIRDADPVLAGYQSSYGFNFTRDAPLSAMMSAWLTYLRPPSLRRQMFRLRARLQGREARSEFLSHAYLSQVIDTSFPYMSRYFKFDRVSSDLQFARMCTLEYLFSRLGAGFPS